MISTPYLNKSEVKKIGIFRALQLGDMLCIIPAVRAVKSAYPHADIILIGLPWQRDFVKRFAHYFSDFIEFPGWPGLPERTYEPSEVVSFLFTMQQEKFDMILQMQGNGYIVNPMCMLFGAKVVAGLRQEGDFCADEKLFPVMREGDHEIKRFLRVAKAIGAPEQGTELEFPILRAELLSFQLIQEQLKLSKGKYICIHPGARDERRRWHPQHFAFIADHLAAEGCSVLLTGSLNEKEILDEVITQMHYPAINLVNECGHVGIGELAAIIGQAAALISNDTGVSHIASALGVPSVIIFSRYSDPQRWRPMNHSLHIAVLPEEAEDPNQVLRIVTAAYAISSSN